VEGNVVNTNHVTVKMAGVYIQRIAMSQITRSSKF